MGGPRNWLVKPAAFGMPNDVEFRKGDPIARSHAQLCHETVVAVNAATAARGWSAARLADELAVNRRYLQRKLSGHLPLTLHDIAAWTQVLDLTVAVEHEAR